MSTNIKSKQSLTFVLPTFNEKENILQLLNEIQKCFNSYELELIVIDDNSKDGTSILVREYAKKKQTR